MGPLNAGFVYMAAVGAKLVVLLIGKKNATFGPMHGGVIQNKGDKSTNSPLLYLFFIIPLHAYEVHIIYLVSITFISSLLPPKPFFPPSYPISRVFPEFN